MDRIGLEEWKDGQKEKRKEGKKGGVDWDFG